MSAQDKLGKFGSFLGKHIDQAIRKAEEMKLKDKLIKGASVVKEGAIDVSKRSQQAYKAFKEEPKIETPVVKVEEVKPVVVEVVKAVTKVEVKKRPKGMSRKAWLDQHGSAADLS